jgi:aryl-alcohol dehydrogenase-like predicted oxidoreductase
VRTRPIAGNPHSPVGLGTTSLTFADVGERTATRTVHAALDAGLTCVDTAYVYTTADAAHHGERLAARALASHPGGRDALAYSPLGGRRRVRGLADARPAPAEVAGRHGVSPQRVAVAWLLTQSPDLAVVVGARGPATITDSAPAADLALDDDDLRLLADG